MLFSLWNLAVHSESTIDCIWSMGCSLPMTGFRWYNGWLIMFYGISALVCLYIYIYIYHIGFVKE